MEISSPPGRRLAPVSVLEQSDMYVTSIALSVGFSNFPYFSTQFKKFSGLTPVEYRKKYRAGTSNEEMPNPEDNA